jgi:hypothetical protein|nr:hypothetical protein [Kofleriaceae bacterium]
MRLRIPDVLAVVVLAGGAAMAGAGCGDNRPGKQDGGPIVDATMCAFGDAPIVDAAGCVPCGFTGETGVPASCVKTCLDPCGDCPADCPPIA